MTANLFTGTSVSVHVKDLEKARRFYRDTLGLPEKRWNPEGDIAEYAMPGPVSLTIHRMFDGHTGRPPGTVSGICFFTGDAERTVRELRKRGVAVTDEPEKFSWGTIATIADPEGNEFVVMSTSG